MPVGRADFTRPRAVTVQEAVRSAPVARWR
jgi:hypothetical protein